MKKICPVCNKKYIMMASKNKYSSLDHYYHIVEDFVGVKHYPPSGLCTIDENGRSSFIQGKRVEVT